MNNPEHRQENSKVNSILPSSGDIYAITGGSNLEHESKRARREYQRRVHTVSPRLLLNRPAWSLVPITFTEEDFQVRDYPHCDAFVATTNVAGFTFHNILIDNGSSTDILFIKAYESMGLNRRTLTPARNALFGFGGRRIKAIGKTELMVGFAEEGKVRTEKVTFDVVNMDYPYTAIFGRGMLCKFDAVIRQSYLCMKMPSAFGVITVHGNHEAARRIEAKPIPGYSMVNKVSKKPENQVEEDEQDPGERSKTTEPRMEPAEESCRVPLSENHPEKTVHIGTSLSLAEKEELIKFLNDSKEVFTWSANDLQGVSRDLAQHSLNVDKMFIPKK